MEGSKKKAVMIAVVIGCLVVAAAITFTGGPKSTGIERLAGQQQWIMCTNTDCEAEYTMDKKEYHEWRKKNLSFAARGESGMVCQECGEQTVFGAVKCGNEKCGHVFLIGAAGGLDFTDRCPECGYSKTEEERKQAR